MTSKNETKYIIYRLNNSFLSKDELIGILTLAIYSKEIFPKNSDVSSFIEKTFSIKYLSYVTKSRTLMCARLMRELASYDEDKIKKTNKNIKNFVSYVLADAYNEDKPSSRNKSNNANKDVGKWITGILGKKK